MGTRRPTFPMHPPSVPDEPPGRRPEAGALVDLPAMVGLAPTACPTTAAVGELDAVGDDVSVTELAARLTVLFK